MGIYGDIKETRNLWKNSSFPTKIMIIVFLFLTFSAITSIADVVFKWKGFVLDGVCFYQQWVRNPIADLFSFIKIPYFVVDLVIPFLIGISILLGLLQIVWVN